MKPVATFFNLLLFLILPSAQALHAQDYDPCNPPAETPRGVIKFLSDERDCIKKTFPDLVKSRVDFLLSRYILTRKLDSVNLMNLFVAEARSHLTSLSTLLESWQALSLENDSNQNLLQLYLLMNEINSHASALAIRAEQTKAIRDRWNDFCSEKQNLESIIAMDPRTQFPVSGLKIVHEDFQFYFSVSVPIVHYPQVFSYESGAVQFTSNVSDPFDDKVIVGVSAFLCGVAGAFCGGPAGAEAGTSLGVAIGTGIGNMINFFRAKTKHVEKTRQTYVLVNEIRDAMIEIVNIDSQSYLNRFTQECNKSFDQSLRTDWTNLSDQLSNVALEAREKANAVSTTYIDLGEEKSKHLKLLSEGYFKDLASVYDENIKVEFAKRETIDTDSRAFVKQHLAGVASSASNISKIGAIERNEKLWDTLLLGDANFLPKESTLDSSSERGFWQSARKKISKELDSYE